MFFKFKRVFFKFKRAIEGQKENSYSLSQYSLFIAMITFIVAAIR